VNELVLALLVGAFAAMAALAALALVLRRRLRHERANAEALRRALEARLWEDCTEQFEPRDAGLLELRRLGHDVNNALSAALLSSQLFFDATRADSPSADGRADLATAAEQMIDALKRLKALIESERKPTTIATPSSDLLRPVELPSAVSDCADRARARHPRIRLTVRAADPDAHGLRVAVCCGGEGLARALDALLENACQGNGVRPSGRVELSVSVRREVDVAALEIADDGPGFTKAELEMPIEAFRTARAGALGLGLYTAERIARASGGSLRRENGASGGAVVWLFLPVRTNPRTRYSIHASFSARR